MLVAYQTLLGSFTRPLASFVNFGSTLQELQADMNRLDDVLRYPADAQYRVEAAAGGRRQGRCRGRRRWRGRRAGGRTGDHPPPGAR